MPHPGLLVLTDVFPQVRVDHAACVGAVVHSVSGPQQATSELVAELMEQLDFAAGTYDLLVRPVIHHRDGGEAADFLPDLLVEMRASNRRNAARRYVIDVAQPEGPESVTIARTTRVALGTRAAASIGGEYRVVTEPDIRTPYLGNARLLRDRQRGDPDLAGCDILEDVLGHRPTSVANATKIISARGIDSATARASIEIGVAWNILTCDLRKPFDDGSRIRVRRPGEFSDPDASPILRMLARASR